MSVVSVMCYDSGVYAGLNHYRVARTFEPFVQEASARFRALFERHGVQAIGGIGLLHKHFEIDEHERLVEHVTGTSSVVEPSPANAAGEIVPYLWKVELDDTGSPRLFPLEYTTDVSQAEVVSRLLEDSMFLAEFCALVVELKATEIIGLTLIHRQHIESVNGGSQEYANEAGRQLKITPKVEESREDHESTVTGWSFEKPDTKELACRHCRHCSHTK